jgi:ubiquinone/menaquinone biosynthesis C-methylase UbiE
MPVILDPNIKSYYEQAREGDRLERGPYKLELARTQELVLRFLPPASCKILDIGGGTGIYAGWLASIGYEVHLLDVMPNHIEQAKQDSTNAQVASFRVGDARELPYQDHSADAVLLFGPLYHLLSKQDRLKTLSEAYRVLRPKGIMLAVGISRYALLLDGLFEDFYTNADFAITVLKNVTTGEHDNPKQIPHYFTTAFFYHPNEFKSEVSEAGFDLENLYAIEGPARLMPDFDDHWDNLERRELILNLIRLIETEPTVIGSSAHMMIVGRKG